MASTYRTVQFKKLQREWDKKLKSTGFDDIEDRNSPREFLKRWHGSYFRAVWSDSKEAYFTKARAFLTWFQFQSKVEKEIWERHAEGQTLREIAEKKISK